MMKAYLVDPIAREIVEVETPEDSASLYALLGCRTFQILAARGLAGRDGLYVDEDARLKAPFFQKRMGTFHFKGFFAPILGRALVVGHTADGECCDPKTPIARVRKMVAFS